MICLISWEKLAVLSIKPYYNFGIEHICRATTILSHNHKSYYQQYNWNVDIEPILCNEMTVINSHAY